MAAEDAALETFEHGPVSRDGEAPIELVPPTRLLRAFVIRPLEISMGMDNVGVCPISLYCAFGAGRCPKP